MLSVRIMNCNWNSSPSQVQDSTTAKERCAKQKAGHPTPWPAFGVSNIVPVQQSPELCIDTVKKWIKTCDSHPICSSVTGNKLPKRILDLGPHRFRNAISLLETGDEVYGRYMTLSHCWGSQQPITTTKATLPHRTTSIRVSELPQTFRDAILMSRGLGIRYLWIDSLCILQDDRLDWEQESAKMAAVYTGSYLNIAATHARNSIEGCFSGRWTEVDVNMLSRLIPLRSFDIEKEFDGDNFTVHVRLALERGHGDFRVGIGTQPYRRRAPLFSRAWVFQERCLAPRTVHFHAHEMIWECKTTVRCECKGTDVTDWSQRWHRGWKALHLEIEVADFRELSDLWLEVVVRFSSLRLSHESDRLPALSGIASRFCGSKLKTYLAGLWREDLARGLLWFVGFDWISSSTRPLPLQAPTWSWASVLLNKEVDNIFYPFIQDFQNGFLQEPHFEVLEVHCCSSGVNSFGEVSSGGMLVLRSSFTSAVYSVRKNSRPFVELVLDSDIDGEDDVVLVSLETMYSDVKLSRSDIDEEPTATSRIVHCLFLGSSTPNSSDGSERCLDYGLVIKSSMSSEDTYERIGFVQTQKEDGSSYGNWFNQTAIGVFRLE